MQLNLQSERLSIRPLTIIDAGFMLQLMNSPNWIKNIGDRQVKNKTEASNYILNKIIPSYHKFGFGLFLVQSKLDKKPIGICGIVKRDGLITPDLGFAFLPEMEGRGFATEASRLVIQFAKEALQLPTLAGITKPENTASIKVLEKLGMKLEKSIQLPQDTCSFSLFTMALHKAI
ncbi:GNAT family N-acetyltransferase [Sediminibacterium sp.]|uniref:GNAT family N-acetyltransferase n=1 Tax=Sediminibacterium sp. TaxID=1917865 RepID=UPI003F6EDA22